MGKTLETTLRGRGASDALMWALREEGLLNAGRLTAVATQVLESGSEWSRAPMSRRSGTGRRASKARRSSPGLQVAAGRAGAPEGDSAHLQLLAAMALCYL